MNTNKIDTPTLILIVILMMGLINGLMSCTGSKVVYRMGDSWKPASKQSEITGWVRAEKK